MEVLIVTAFLITVAGAITITTDAISIIRNPNEDNKQTFFAMFSKIVLTNIVVIFIIVLIWLVGIMQYY